MRRIRENPYLLALYNPRKRTASHRRLPIRRERFEVENPYVLALYNKDRRRGYPRTDIERRSRHYRRYGTTELPPRGTGLRRVLNPPPPPTIETKYGWKERKPIGYQREEMLKKYGPECFLRPETLSYPVCNRKTGKYDCDGLRAAYVRARQQHDHEIEERAIKVAKKLKCEWAVKRHNPEFLSTMVTGAAMGAGAFLGSTAARRLTERMKRKRKNPTQEVIIDDINTLLEVCKKYDIFRSNAEFYNYIGYASLADMTIKELLDLRWELRDKLIEEAGFTNEELTRAIGD